MIGMQVGSETERAFLPTKRGSVRWEERMKDEAKVIGRRWDHSANGYNDIIQREFTEAGEAWTQRSRHREESAGCGLRPGISCPGTGHGGL